MLKIEHDTLPQSLLSYLAFRVAFRETAERIVLWKQFERDLDEIPGYLGEVPFLREVPVQVQLELLATTWSRHLSRDLHQATLLDEAVVYAVCESAALLVDRDPPAVTHYLKGGPLDLTVPVDHHLTNELRALYLNLSNSGDFLLMSQFLDIPPDDARDLKQQMGMQLAGAEPLFDVLGRWHVDPAFSQHLDGLLNPAEQQRVLNLLGVPCTAQ